ncbi:hypothetical protein Vadar_019278 [Vaccinium darrowii]|uniref:Uncharacterized protein n=1 Tax=Vaccinium darrowii TaxID=229202 RepID=A0ACB7Y030_9ERIC|nr:hypothetical protein Vadar_019278 [Vaccinium darrowii]
MRPEKKPSPSLGYILVETTDVDSTTNKSTTDFPTTDSPTTITVEVPPLEQPTPFPTQPPSPPPPGPQLSPKPEADFWAIIGRLLLFLGACVILYVALVRITDLMVSGIDPYGPEIHVHSVSFNLHNISSSQITTKGEITFNVTKPLDCSVSTYDNLEVSIFYEGNPLSMTIIEPFTQKEMNHTMVNATFPSITSPIEARISKRMASYFISNSSFEFSFDVKAIGYLWPDKWLGPGDFRSERWLTIWCPNVKVEIVTKTGLGTMAGEPLKCEVRTRHAI